MERKSKILDTNVLLDFPQIVTKDDDWIISYSVLHEIDGLKNNRNPETGRKARKAAVYISKNMNNLKWDFTEPQENETTDDLLLRLTKEKGGILITNDVALKVKAGVLSIPTEGYSWKENYSGTYLLNIENMNEEDYNLILSVLYNKGTLEVDVDHVFSTNEYLIVPPYYGENGRDSIFRFDGNTFISIRGKEIENNWCGSIFPKNREQICLVNAMINKIPILYVGGGFGTGKTFLTHNYAIGELEKEHIKKIVYVPNNAYTQNTMELGALPGSIYDKIYPMIGPLIDLVGIDQVQRWLSDEKLEIVPVAYIRGRNFNDSIIIVSEAENLTEEHIKLLLGRCGENTRIFFDGDIHQADSAIFKDRNGLKLLLNLHDSPYAGMFATVQLKKIERSEVASAADYLDDI